MGEFVDNHVSHSWDLIRSGFVYSENQLIAVCNYTWILHGSHGELRTYYSIVFSPRDFCLEKLCIKFQGLNYVLEDIVFLTLNIFLQFLVIVDSQRTRGRNVVVVVLHISVFSCDKTEQVSREFQCLFELEKLLLITKLRAELFINKLFEFAVVFVVIELTWHGFVFQVSIANNLPFLGRAEIVSQLGL